MPRRNVVVDAAGQCLVPIKSHKKLTVRSMRAHGRWSYLSANPFNPRSWIDASVIGDDMIAYLKKARYAGRGRA